MTQTASGVARWTFRLGVMAAAAYLGGPLLAHVQLIPALAGFACFGLGGVLGLGATLLGVVARIRARATWAALAPGAVIAAWFLITAAGGRQYPAINDITTNVTQPPEFVNAGTLSANRQRDLRYPGDSFAQQQRAGYPTLTGLPLAVPPDAAFQRVVRAARGMSSWQITREDPVARALEGVDTTWLFRFQDDVVIEVRPRDDGSIVEMRSKSRDGRGDIGANAQRITAFFERVKREERPAT